MVDVIAKCGGCEGALFFFTCDHAHGTGHEWALAGICVGCRTVTWINSGCPECSLDPAPTPPGQEDE